VGQPAAPLSASAQ